MSWHVRFFSPSLQQDLLSPELATKEEAMREAWTLAEQGEDVTAVEGPDGGLVSTEEIEVWAQENAEPSAPSA